MKDPIRLKDVRSGSSETLRELLRAGRSEAPSAARLRAIGAGILTALTSAGRAAGAGAGPAAPWLAASAKIGLAATVVAVGIGGAAVAYRAHTAPSASGSVSAALAPQVASIADSTSTASRPPEPEPGFPSVARDVDVALAVRPEPARARPRPHAVLAGHERQPAPDDGQDAQSAEIALVKSALEALDRAPALALDLASQHRARFPSGLLAQEREVIAIQALIRMDRTAEARARGAEFLQRFPGSAHRLRVQGLLARSRETGAGGDQGP